MVKSQNYSSLSIQSSDLKKENQIAKLDSLLWIWYQIELNCSVFIRKIFNFGKSKRSVPKFEETSSIETMAVTSDHDDATKICSHCDRAIPSTNMELHYFHCSRNLEKCKICGDMIPKKLAVEHYSTTHAPVSCSQCNETMEPRDLAVHEGEKCPQRITTCDYCEFPLPAIDLSKHQEVCGNRTELCQLCNRYIRLREKLAHELSCNGVTLTNSTPETSRATREAEREHGPRRRETPHNLSTQRLIFTIAITGIAILLGSFIFQNQPDQPEQR
ncbi:hypothetical protein R6Q57_013216 [Mikania cordata]